MLKEERFDHIINLLKRNGKVAYDLLSMELNVSEDTIRRDIETLHGNGLLAKVRGGAILPSRNPLSFQNRTEYLTEGKEVIALKAQQFINKGQTVFMDGGTTICAIAAHLPLDSSFRVVTNNQALIPILSKFKGVEIIVLGGVYNRNTETNTGVKTCEEVKQYVADLYFMGTCAVQSKFGITAVVNEDGEVKQAMLNSSIKKVAFSNAEKLDSVHSFKVCDIQEIDVLITDIPSDDNRLDAYRNLGIKLV
ncbi:DeoR/GlpR family DNA-binding transcription regulator [Pedobacter foliorum]|uniref:DeoR/GlpR family DNA-binding transcription regulator n=1 Tax=Pedobacter foliorum TaxID=2739058 RepID=UPI001567602A|nr:DeoR/GlpR family DNA-binding transcription regulator [Pedobacter foliorum]NRF41645.1 DeoR/GlpR transcriptional regulator [Pedobacter foliorum]